MRRQNSAFVPQDSMYPFQGLDYQDPSTLVDPHLAPELENINVDKGHLIKRHGFSLLGGAINGIPLKVIEFETLAGAKILVLITTTKEYKLVAGAWVDITFTVHAAGAPTNRTGTEEDGIDYVVTSGIDSLGNFVKWLIITNGVDKPRYWDGTLSTFWQFSTDAQTDTNPGRGAGLLYTGLVTFKTITSLNNYLIIANTTLASNEPSTVAWSDTGSLYDFGTGVLGEGNSGAIPLVDALGPLQKVMVLADRVMIYADDSVHAMTHIGGNDIFSFERIINETRLASPRAIIDIGLGHIFLSQENIYLYDGSRNLLPLADSIALRLREEIQTSLKARAWAFLDRAKNQIYWSIPTSDVTNVIYKMEYDLNDIRRTRWVKHTYSQRLTTMGFWTRTSSLPWTALVGTWSQQAYNWSQGSIKSGFPQRVIGYSGQTGIQDDTVWTDNTVAIKSFVDSIDLTVPPDTYLTELGRWSKLDLELRGSNVDIYYSTDRGVNFQLLQSNLVLSDSWQKYTVDIDVCSETLRIRLQNADFGNFELRWFRAFVKSGGL